MPERGTQRRRRARWLGLGLAAGLAAFAAGWATVGATPVRRQLDQPTTPSAPVVLTGQLWPNRPGCGAGGDATMRVCENHDFIWVRAPGINLERHIWGYVRVQGTLHQCGADRYIEVTALESIQQCAGTPGTPERTNLAWRAPVYASTELPDFPRANITDDNPLTYWYTPGADGWVYVDLGQTVTFNEARLMWSAPHATQYGIYVWDPATEPPGWVMIKARSGGTADENVTFARTFARYVLVHMIRSSDAGGGFGLRELRIFGVSTPNLALGAQVDASSFQSPDGLPQRAVDGDDRTAWASDPAPDRLYPWIRVHFPKRTALTEFRLLWDANHIARAYWVGFYEGSQVALWSERFVSRNPRQQYAWPDEIAADAFIVMGQGVPASGFLRLFELELYGPAAGVLGASPIAGRARLPLAEPLGGASAQGVVLDGSGPAFKRRASPEGFAPMDSPLGGGFAPLDGVSTPSGAGSPDGVAPAELGLEIAPADDPSAGWPNPDAG